MKKIALTCLCCALLNVPAHAVENLAWELDTVHCISPEYPREAAHHDASRSTGLELLIRTDGAIAATRVRSSSGSQVLDMAAQDALAKCHFKPRTAVAPEEEVWQKLTYVWTPDDNHGLPPRRIDFSTCTRAAYPAEARQHTMPGTLTLGLLVRPDGTVRETRLVRSSGHAELDSVARNAMAACRFLDGPVKPTVDEWATLDYVWSAEDLPEQVRRNQQ